MTNTRDSAVAHVCVTASAAALARRMDSAFLGGLSGDEREVRP